MLTGWDLMPSLAWRKTKTNKPVMDLQASISGLTDGHMDDEVNWSALPEDLMDRIFSCLPLTSILRLRCVCKRWNSLLQSKKFLSSLAKISTPKPWFILCTMGSAACSYDPAMNKWHTIIRPVCHPCTSVLAVAGSLLCLGNQVAECKFLSICNPITKSFRQLPRMLQVSLIHKVSMIADPSNNSYKIMVSGENGLPIRNPYTYDLLTEVYDSSVNSWRMSGKPLADAKFGSDPGVWCNELYYCITELPYGVVVFDLKTESWSEIKVEMPASLASPSLVESGGHLLMIGRVMNGSQTQDTGPRITIWELQLGRKEWVEVRTMPEDICREFCAPMAFYSPFVCSGLENHIYITTHLNPHVLVHDLSENSWQWLPSDPFFPRKRDFHLLGFGFHPRLDASP
eukprot:Gb_06118 [translate_table: standard]